MVPDMLLTLRLPHNSLGEHPVICFMAVQGHRSLPMGPASLQRHRTDEDRSNGFTEQLAAQEADTTLSANVRG